MSIDTVIDTSSLSLSLPLTPLSHTTHLLLPSSFAFQSPFFTAEAHSRAHMDDTQSNYHPLSHSQMESQLTDSQDPDSLHHSDDSALMLGDGDDLDGYLEEDDRDELTRSEVHPPRKLLRLHTSGELF